MSQDTVKRMVVSAVSLAGYLVLGVLLGVKQRTAGEGRDPQMGNQGGAAGIVSFPTHIPCFEHFSLWLHSC